MKAGARTLFDILGVAPDATDQDVEAARLEHLVKAGGQYDAIPQEVWEACEVLSTGAGRMAYKRILEACYGRFAMQVHADEVDNLRAICGNAGIRIFRHPKKLDSYVFRAADQEDPHWSEEDSGFPREPEPVLRQMARGLWRFVTLQLFLGTTVAQKLGLFLLYAIIFGSIAYGVRWTAGAVAEHQANALQESIHDQLGQARSALASLEREAESFAEEFADLVQAPLGTDERSREVNLAILRHATVKEGWAAIRDDHVRQEEIQELRDTLANVEGNTARGAYRKSDERVLQQTLATIRERRRSVQSLRQDLDHIRVMLDVDRLDRAKGNKEGSSP